MEVPNCRICCLVRSSKQASTQSSSFCINRIETLRGRRKKERKKWGRRRRTFASTVAVVVHFASDRKDNQNSNEEENESKQNFTQVYF